MGFSLNLGAGDTTEPMARHRTHCPWRDTEMTSFSLMTVAMGAWLMGPHDKKTTPLALLYEMRVRNCVRLSHEWTPWISHFVSADF